jgi:hypothetical protein
VVPGCNRDFGTGLANGSTDTTTRWRARRPTDGGWEVKGTLKGFKGLVNPISKDDSGYRK